MRLQSFHLLAVLSGETSLEIDLGILGVLVSSIALLQLHLGLAEPGLEVARILFCLRALARLMSAFLCRAIQGCTETICGGLQFRHLHVRKSVRFCHLL